ncbi:MAG TPA: NAD(P)H-binding protein [Bryobacteraceae bacterium]|nr:NAD(P)H-binding protein [Bryobacteraceae bacterium]
MPHVAVIAGATGLVGSHCLRRLSSEAGYSQVIALVRRPSGLSGMERIVNFEQLDLADVPPGADVFCALGTTMPEAGTREAFRKVDFGYVVNLATQAVKQQARQFAVISSVGASPKTSNYYLRTKAEMEQEVSSLPFEAVHLFRPSFLTGHRNQTRPGERIGIAFTEAFQFLLRGPLEKYRVIEADTVAAAMIASVREAKGGVHLYHYREMLALAGRKR